MGLKLGAQGLAEGFTEGTSDSSTEGLLHTQQVYCKNKSPAGKASLETLKYQEAGRQRQVLRRKPEETPWIQPDEFYKGYSKVGQDLQVTLPQTPLYPYATLPFEATRSELNAWGRTHLL